MRKRLDFLGIVTALFMFSIVSQVWADGYEVETVGGVLNPTNIVMTLTQAVFLSITVFGFIIVVALLRIKNTGENGEA